MKRFLLNAATVVMLAASGLQDMVIASAAFTDSPGNGKSSGKSNTSQVLRERGDTKGILHQEDFVPMKGLQPREIWGQLKDLQPCVKSFLDKRAVLDEQIQLVTKTGKEREKAHSLNKITDLVQQLANLEAKVAEAEVAHERSWNALMAHYQNSSDEQRRLWKNFETAVKRIYHTGDVPRHSEILKAREELKVYEEKNSHAEAMTLVDSFLKADSGLPNLVRGRRRLNSLKDLYEHYEDGARPYILQRLLKQDSELEQMGRDRLSSAELLCQQRLEAHLTFRKGMERDYPEVVRALVSLYVRPWPLETYDDFFSTFPSEAIAATDFDQQQRAPGGAAFS
ncbi:hypothetical protein [Candidatus Finniella inopinata]|uniref:Uncharacterized protein n=1 Tax=Candidatus Finniella inopinata TaxID=1696036 RepID=A0A4Q7DH86_9PROT|nr:hypothetical protein [Candidatus Finniella inopinata]RZI45680.1 hypothetical protein EQU50_06150 [Candidatus Finniella inopinata]